eukprot:3099588-Pyramimonas_sp.AAC.1
MPNECAPAGQQWRRAPARGSSERGCRRRGGRPPPPAPAQPPGTPEASPAGTSARPAPADPTQDTFRKLPPPGPQLAQRLQPHPRHI